MAKKILCLCFCCLVLDGCACVQPTCTQEQLAAALKKNPEIFLNVLRENKGALLEIVMAAEEVKRKQIRQEQITKALRNPLHPVLQPGRPILGNPQATITIVEYSDFLCSACAEGALGVKELLKKYPGKIRVVLKHFPSDDLAKKIAMYFEVIGRMDPRLAWKFQDMIFERAKEVRKDKLAAVLKIVSSMGLDQNQVAQQMARPDLARLIKDDLKEVKKFDITATPSFVINGVLINGAPPIFVFEEVINLWEQQNAKDRKAAKPGKGA